MTRVLEFCCLRICDCREGIFAASRPLYSCARVMGVNGGGVALLQRQRRVVASAWRRRRVVASAMGCCVGAASATGCCVGAASATGCCVGTASAVANAALPGVGSGERGASRRHPKSLPIYPLRVPSSFFRDFIIKFKKISRSKEILPL